MIINGENLIMGRLASFAAKQALKGEKIDIYNCENIVITGQRQNVIYKFKRLREIRTPFKGPFIHSNPEKIMKRAIKRMLPFKNERGKEALKRIKCYNKPIKTNEKITPVKNAEFKSNRRFLTLKQVSQALK